MTMHDLLPHAEKVAGAAESAQRDHRGGGIVRRRPRSRRRCSPCRALRPICLGGAVIYTRKALLGLRDVRADMLSGMRPSTEAYALFKARIIRERYGADWGVGETGAAGPTGNRYGDAAGHACLAVERPRRARRHARDRQRRPAGQYACVRRRGAGAAGRKPGLRRPLSKIPSHAGRPEIRYHDKKANNASGRSLGKL